MKKKGFTLIELLGVLVILAIVILLVWTSAARVFHSTRRTLTEENVKLIYSAAEAYVEENIQSFPRYEGNRYCISLETLANEGKLPDDIRNFVTEDKISLKRTVEVVVDSKRGYSYRFDETKNICNVNVILNAMTTSGEMVFDGAEVADSVEITMEKTEETGSINYCISKNGKCSPNKKYSGKITIDEEGEYTIVYNYEDAGGITSENQVFRFSYNRGVPTIVWKVREKANTGDFDYEEGIWTKNSVEVDISESTTSRGTIDKYEIEILKGIGQGKYEDKKLTFDTTGEYEVNGIITTKQGVKTSYTEQTGRTENPYKIRIDKTEPKIKEIKGNPTKWTNGDVTLEIIEATDEGSGLDSSAYSFDGGKNWTSSPKQKYESNQEVDIRVRDKVGNYYTAETVNINRIDKEVPLILSLSKSNDGWTNQKVTLTGTAQDTKSGISYYMFSQDGNLDASSEGWQNVENSTDVLSYKKEIDTNGTYYFYVKDEAGNFSKEKIDVQDVDTKLPVIIDLSASELDWTNQKVTLTGKAKDSESGIYGYQFSDKNDLNADSEGWKILTAQKEITETTDIETNGTYYFYVKDGAGNVVSKKIEIKNIDTTLPVLQHVDKSSESWVSDDVDITVKIKDELSGIVKYQISTSENLTDGDAGWTEVARTTDVIITSYKATSNGYYYLYVIDDAGNMLKELIEIDNIDKDIPNIISVSKESNEWTNGNVKITGIATDELSKIVGYKFSEVATATANDKDWVEVASLEQIEEEYEAKKNGTYYFYVKDAAGNIAQGSIMIDRIDKDKPKFKVSPESNGRATEVSVAISVSDELSGLSDENEYEYYLSTSDNGFVDGNWITYIPESEIALGGEEVTGTYYLYIKTLKDNAKNELEGNVVIDGEKYYKYGPYIFDNTIPTCTIGGVPDTWTDKNVTLTIETTETHLAAEPYLWGTIDSDSDEDTGESEGADFTTNKSLEISEPGTYTASIMNDVGNVGTCSAEVKYIDTKAPVVTLNPDSTQVTTMTDVEFLIEERESGISKDSEYAYYLSSEKGKLTGGDWIPLELDSCKDLSGMSEDVSCEDGEVPNMTKITELGKGLTGTYYLYVKRVKDLVGHDSVSEISQTIGEETNRVPGVDETINGEVYHRFGEYVFDNEAPSCTLTQDPEAYTKGNVTLKISSDNRDLSENPFAFGQSDSGEFSTKTTYSVSENGGYIGYVMDSVGNVGTCSIEVTNIDNENPEIILSFLTNSAEEEYVGADEYVDKVSSTKTVAISAIDMISGLSDENVYEYYLSPNSDSLEGGTKETYENGIDFEMGTNLTGEYYVFVREVVDKMGNKSGGDITVDGIKYKRFGPYLFDNNPPTCDLVIDGSLNSEGDYVDQVKLTLNSSDVGSKISQVGLTTSAVKVYNDTSTLTIDAPAPNKTYYGYVKDSVGNEGNCSTTFEVVLDPLMQTGTEFQTTIEPYKENIITVQVVGNQNNIPSETVATWDVSSKGNGSVKAWLTENASNQGKYDLYIGGVDGKVYANSDSSHLFQSFTSATTINVDLLDTSRVNDMSYMFEGCSNLSTLGVSNFDTSKVTTMEYLFASCPKLSYLDVGDWETGNVRNMMTVFYKDDILDNLDISNWDTSKVTTMESMFNKSYKLSNLDVSKWKTGNVENMFSMFFATTNIETLNVENWDVRKVTTMRSMFSQDSKLKNLDVSKWKTESLTTMYNLFNSVKFTSVDLSGWDVSHVTDMQSAFLQCSELQDIKMFNTSSDLLKNTSYMFASCPNLTTIDLSDLNTTNVNNMENMFKYDTNLTTIYVSDSWTTDKVTKGDNMFLNCPQLVGAVPYDPEKIDVSMANYTNGYLTKKS